MENKQIRKKIIHLTPSKALVDMAEKSKLIVLAEKFLISSFEKSKTLLAELAEERHSIGIFLRSMSWAPIGILAFFAIPTEYLKMIVMDELWG